LERAMFDPEIIVHVFVGVLAPSPEIKPRAQRQPHL